MTKTGCVVIATGGSGGHVIPSERLGSDLEKQGIKVAYLGHNVETNPFLLNSQDTLKINIPSSPVSIKKMMQFFLQNFLGTYKAIKALKQMKPKCVVGFGSYHSFPTLLASSILNVPFILYEANTTLGKVVRLFAHSAKFVASPFALHENLKHFRHVSPLIRGKSIQESKEELCKYFGLDQSKKTLLITGGSQGAQFFNSWFLNKIISELDPKDYQFIHLAGKNHDVSAINAIYHEYGFRAHVKHFEVNMEKAYGLADYVICRSGATTLFELSFYKKKALIVPFPKSASDHQLLNANFFAKYHPSIVIQESLYEDHNLCNLLLRLDKLEKEFSNCELFSNLETLSSEVLALC